MDDGSHANVPVSNVPVWGIETGDGKIRAVRVARREEGGFTILAYEEAPEEEAGPEALISFLRRKGIRKHPIVVAISSPTAHLTHATLPPDIIGQPEEDVRMELLEHVHPEPEEVDVRTRALSSDTYLVVSEERARVEAYLVAMEGADAPAYALTSSLASTYCLLRDNGLFEQDGLVARITPRWTDLLFLDGVRTRHLGLPISRGDLDADDGRERLAGDLQRLRGFHRSRVKTEDDAEPFVLLGAPPDLEADVAKAMSVEPVPFPGEAPLFKGKGKIRPERVAEILRNAPGAVGAAIAGAASPRRLDLAFRPLPDVIRAPASPIGAWLAASALLVVAFVLAVLGASRGTDEILSAADRLERSSRGPSPEAVARLEALNQQARRTLALPRTVERLLAALPPESAAPYRTTRIDISARPDGGYDAAIDLVLPETGDPGMGPRYLDWLRSAEERFPDGLLVEPGRDGDESVVRIRYSVVGAGR